MKKREASPPGWYGRSKRGRYFRICRTAKRDPLTGEKCYRLEYYNPDISEPFRGNGLFTLELLKESGVHFLRNRPSCAPKDGAKRRKTETSHPVSD